MSTNVKTLLIPHPTGKIDATKNNKSPTPLGHKKVPKPLVAPINAPYFPGVGEGVGVSVDRCITAIPFYISPC